jgi:hypothetical protein
MILLLYFVLPPLAAAAAGLFVFLWRRRHRQPMPARLGFATAALMFAVFPLPTHGGLTCWGMIALQSAFDALRAPNSSHERLPPPRQQRFVGPLPIEAGELSVGQWQAVHSAGSEPAWLDTVSGLVFDQALPWSDADWPDLQTAREACARRAPSGHWALPDAAELMLFERAGGEAVAPSGPQGRFAELWQPALGMALPQVTRGRAPGFALRCVALGPGAPGNGYSQQDIPLDEWNAHQLRKMGATAEP